MSSEDELKATIEFVARWCWRTNPPNSNSSLTESERFNAIKYHPVIKKFAQPHIELAEKERDI